MADYINSNLIKTINNRIIEAVSEEAITQAVTDYLIEHPPTGYEHPATHPASMIEESDTLKFVTLLQKAQWGNHYVATHAPADAVSLATVKGDTDVASAITLKHSNSQDHSNSLDHTAGMDQGLDTGGANAVTAAQTKTAYTHSQAAHAPSNAQANADITKAEIEAKLTGEIATHTHAGGADPFLAKLVVAADKPTGANTTPVTLGISFDYIANSKYIIDTYAMVAPTAAGTGCGFLIDVSTAVTYVGTFTAHQLAATGTLSGGSSIGDLGATSQGVSSGMVGTGNNFVSGSAMVITGANAGTATFYFRSETTAVTTCKSGSVMDMSK